MTDQEKLKQLFEAALKDTSDLNKAPTRAFVTPSVKPIPPTSPPPEPVQEIAPAPVAVVEIPVAPPVNAGLDDATATELGVLLDEQRARIKRRHIRQTLTTLAVCLALCGGGFGWFVQSPDRVQAFKDAIKDVRSVGDVKSLVANYRDALDRVAARSQQIDQATAAMGVKASAADEEDPYFDAEMQEMMGGEGKTVGQRNKALQQNFDQMKTESGVETVPVSRLAETNSFEWSR